jgi:hypothetical protein
MDFRHDFAHNVHGWGFDTLFSVGVDSLRRADGLSTTQFLPDTVYSIERKEVRRALKENFSFYLEVAINDSLLPQIKLAKIYLRQSNGGLFPPHGSYYFSGWGFNAGLYALSAPLVANLAFELGFDYFFLDMDPAFNNHVDPNDAVIEFYVGVKWGFL